MPKRLFYCLILLSAAFGVVSCSSEAIKSTKSNEPAREKPEPIEPKPIPQTGAKPTPPLQLSVPAALPERLGDKDLKNMDRADLDALARQAANEKQYKLAAASQYWYVQKSRQGQYDLACYAALAGQTDSAFYWLQLAAIDEGVDTQHAQRDEDLESLRRDSRWAKVLRYMQECNQYFESSHLNSTLVVLPKGYKKSAPIPAVVWLHGLGSRPDDFVNEGCQEYANELNVAIIGVSGTRARGPRSFVWAEDVEEDARRIRSALSEVGDRVTIQKGQIITLGFSQGAQVGLDVAVKYPEEFAGAIVLSPGAQPHLDEVKPSPLLARRGFVLSCGAAEHPGNVQLTTLDAAWLRRAKAKVIDKLYPGVSAHSFPRDFDERFPEWVRFILKAGKSGD